MIDNKYHFNDSSTFTNLCKILTAKDATLKTDQKHFKFQ